MPITTYNIEPEFTEGLILTNALNPKRLHMQQV